MSPTPLSPTLNPIRRRSARGKFNSMRGSGGCMSDRPRIFHEYSNEDCLFVNLRPHSWPVFPREIGIEPARSTSRNPLERVWGLSAEEYRRRAGRVPSLPYRQALNLPEPVFNLPDDQPVVVGEVGAEALTKFLFERYRASLGLAGGSGRPPRPTTSTPCAPAASAS